MSASPASAPHALLRRAGPGDAAGVAALLDALGYPCSRDDAARRIEAMSTDERQQLVVADWHGELLGLVAIDLMYYLPLGATTCRITALSVGAGARRRGMGRRLLREAEALAREAGAARIELTTANHREQAHAFYRACGYEEAALRFVKRLGAA
jgi:ribosomal protein S18 acetylase RimI-like enzyme